MLVYQLKLRGYSPRTIKAYCGHVSRLYRYYREHPELSVLDIVSQFSYFLLSRKLSHDYVNQAISGVKFYLEEVCDSLEGSYSYVRPKKEKKLPNVLGKREVMKLLSFIQNRKHQAIFYLIYSSGLRVGEVVRLRLGDIDRERKTLHIRQGKGRKDRLTVLSDLALTVIQSYIEDSRPEGWLFPGQQPGSHLTERTVQKVFEQALKAASINKEVSVHALRHSFATHLLEDGIDIRYIQEFLGHKSTRTTEIYTHVAVKDVRRIMSPLDRIVESSQD
ncbi:integrase [Cohnella endophytica]|uniref:Integrase n=1 Tax=Cohnella endophytica TaxID=2419778 RepID=A0A494Y075_9BACL|nr:integrase [Cohnella endophytica]